MTILQIALLAFLAALVGPTIGYAGYRLHTWYAKESRFGHRRALRSIYMRPIWEFQNSKTYAKIKDKIWRMGEPIIPECGLNSDLVSETPFYFEFDSESYDSDQDGRFGWWVNRPSAYDSCGDVEDLENFAERFGVMWEDVRETANLNDDDDDSEFFDDLADALEELMNESDDFWPMMNYALPSPETVDPGDLVGYPLISVSVCGNPYLALTAGGMDMRWEICAAYVALGYLPPAFYCDLPAMAGMRADRAVLDACKRSAMLQSEWSKRTAISLERFES